jgi:hypothetical protein
LQNPDQSGQQMVEFTFTFIIVIALFAALLIFGWIFFSYATIVNAARDGSYHIWTHADGHPDDPATYGEFGVEAETRAVITRSVPLLNWREMTITITPPREQWVPGGFVAVEIIYDVPLPQIDLPLAWNDTVITIMGPLRLQSISRRSFD